MGGNPTEYGLIDAKNSFFKKEGVISSIRYYHRKIKLDEDRSEIEFNKMAAIGDLFKSGFS